MKAGLLKNVAKGYAAFFHPPWQRVRNEFMRLERDWVQIVSFNPSRFDDVYEPRICFEFLHMPGDPTGGFLVHPLRHPNGTQRWVKASKIADPASNDSAEKIFAEIVRQFKPSLWSR